MSKKLKILKDVLSNEELSYSQKIAREWINAIDDVPGDVSKIYYEFCILCGKWVSNCEHWDLKNGKYLFDSQETYAIKAILKHIFDV